jgi:hypothetical protein
MRSLIAVLSLFAITACGTLQTQPVLWHAGVTFAVRDYVYDKPADKQEATRERIRSIAGDLKATAAGEAVTLPLLRQALTVQLERAGLEPHERALWEGLADVLVAEIGKRIGSGVIKPDQLFEVITVLEIVERAAV